MEKLTKKQNLVFDLYKKYIEKYGYSPTYQEAGDLLDLDPSVVFYHIKNIEKKGYLSTNSDDRSVYLTQETITVPIIGFIACGEPISVSEEELGSALVPKTKKCTGALYGLIARGESMKDAGINNNDILIIRKQDDVQNGDIGVVVMQNEDDIEETATLKRVYHNAKSLILRPENDNFPVTVANRAVIRGKLIDVQKK